MDTLSREKLNGVLEIASKYLVGQRDLLESILAAIICEGHLLIEGLPGLGKTSSIQVMGRLCDLAFGRVQFTPDLLPSDLVGTQIFSREKEEFVTVFGPIFTQILLADEINRSPAKVQSALLEAMAERQVTIAGQSYQLRSPFVVVATQNPIEHEGTYALPEAQLDRFMMKVTVKYPAYLDEVKILDIESSLINELGPILSVDNITSIQKDVRNIYVDEKIKQLIVKIVHSTRPQSEYFSHKYKESILYGASPRAGIWMMKSAKFFAYLQGQDFVSPDHLLKVAPAVLGHRIITSYEAKLDKISEKNIALELTKSFL